MIDLWHRYLWIVETNWRIHYQLIGSRVMFALRVQSSDSYWSMSVILASDWSGWLCPDNINDEPFPHKMSSLRVSPAPEHLILDAVLYKMIC